MRLPIDRVFSARGFGTVVTGTLIEGRIAVGDELVLLPRGLKATARGAARARRSREPPPAPVSGSPSTWVASSSPTSRAATRWRHRARSASTRRVDARVDMLPDAPPLRHGLRVRFHQGTTEVLGRVSVAGVIAIGDDRGLPISRTAARAAGQAAPPVEIRSRSARLRATAARVAGGAHAGRSLHPALVLAIHHHRRRRRARPGTAARGAADGVRMAALRRARSRAARRPPGRDHAGRRARCRGPSARQPDQPAGSLRRLRPIR